MQQLEDAQNIGLCGHFLISLADMCFAAFLWLRYSIQYLGACNIRKKSIVICVAVWSGRFAFTSCLHPRVEHLNIIFRQDGDNCISRSAKLKFQYQIARKIICLSTGDKILYL